MITVGRWLQRQPAWVVFGVFYLGFFCTSSCSVLQNTLQERYDLYFTVGKTLLSVMPNPGNNCYILPVLEPLSSYEVRVSYVGAIPAIYTLSFACQNDRGSNQPFQHQQRELLDTSKLIFSTDHHGLPTNSGCQRVCVYGRYDSAPIKDSAVPAVLHYTIILESLAFNVLPSSLIGVVMFILFLLVASQFWVAPLLINFIRKFPE